MKRDILSFFIFLFFVLSPQISDAGKSESIKEYDYHYIPVVTDSSDHPDAFGYTWVDNNNGGSPIFNWIDISEIGDSVEFLYNNDAAGPFPLGFNFSFYGDTFNQFYIASNGFITFETEFIFFPDFPMLPNPLPPNGLICPLAGELDLFSPSSEGLCYYYSNNIDSCMVSWINVPESNDFYGTTSHTFQLILTAVDSSITFQYGPQNGQFQYSDGNPQIGMEDITGQYGLLYMYDWAPIQRIPHDSLVIRIHPDSDMGSVEGIVTEIDGVTPIEEVLLRALQNGEEFSIGFTGTDGKYILTGLHEGYYDLEASKYGYVQHTIENIEISGGQIETVNIVLENTLGGDTIISYDSGPFVYWPRSQIGTRFAVHFTVPMNYVLYGIYLASYQGSGNCLVHVWSDSCGYPHQDIIEPFTTTLAGNLSYQLIVMPSPIDIGSTEFHVGIEYQQPSPPYMTGDGEDTINDRSKRKNPEDNQWIILECNLCIRALVSNEAYRISNFQLIEPGTDSVYLNTPSPFIWHSAIDVDSGYTVYYKLYIDTDPLFSDPFSSNVFSDTVYALPDFLEGSILYYWRVFAFNNHAFPAYSDETWNFYIDLTGINDHNNLVPNDYILNQSYPNPFNDEVTIKYGLPEQAYVTIQIYDILGRKVSTLIDKQQPAGYYQAIWKAIDFSSGIYFYELQAGDFIKTKRMMLLK